MRNKMTSIYLHEDTLERLKVKSVELNKPMAEIIREAILAWLDRESAGTLDSDSSKLTAIVKQNKEMLEILRSLVDADTPTRE